MAKKQKIKLAGILILSMTLLGSCASKEEKASKLIKEELSKTLLDFESYQPIETEVKEAKLNLFNDTAFWKNGQALAYSMKESSDYLDRAESAKKKMNIWGPPTAYSSSYSDEQYYQYKKEYEDANSKAMTLAYICKGLAKIMQDSIAKCDTSKVIGWEVKHRFRCKTRGGNSTIADYRYIIDKGFTKILLREDKDDKDDERVRVCLEGVMNGYWEKLLN